MSSLEERLEAACCEDSTIAIPAQQELVRAVMGRLVGRQSLGADGISLLSLAPDEGLCDRCGQKVDEARYCNACSHINSIKRSPAAQTLDGSRATGQEGF